MLRLQSLHLKKLLFLNLLVLLSCYMAVDATELSALNPKGKDGKMGFVDSNGNWVIEPEFNFVSDFNADGLASVKTLNNKGNLINTKGQLLLPENKYDSVSSDFSHADLAVVSRDGKYGFIDRTLNEKIPLQFDYAVPFSDNGLTVVWIDKLGCWRYINTNGDSFIPRCFKDIISDDEYDSVALYGASSFSSNGLAAVNINGKGVFINASGEPAFPKQFDAVKYFINEYDQIMPYADNGLSAVKLNDDWGYIDENGKTIIPFFYQDAHPFDENYPELARVKKNNKWGVINNEGEKVIPFIYDEMPYPFFENGLIYVEAKGKKGVVDIRGETVIPIIYEKIGRWFSESGLIEVKKDKKWGFYNQNGKVLIPFNYDYATGFERGLALVKKGDKWGFINHIGEVAIPFKYEMAFPFTITNQAYVFENGTWIAINEKGRIISKPDDYKIKRLNEAFPAINLSQWEP